MVLEGGGGGGEEGGISLACSSPCLTHHHWHLCQAGRSEVKDLLGCRDKYKWLRPEFIDSDTYSGNIKNISQTVVKYVNK